MLDRRSMLKWLAALLPVGAAVPAAATTTANLRIAINAADARSLDEVLTPHRDQITAIIRDAAAQRNALSVYDPMRAVRRSATGELRRISIDDRPMCWQIIPYLDGEPCKLTAYYADAEQGFLTIYDREVPLRRTDLQRRVYGRVELRLMDGADEAVRRWYDAAVAAADGAPAA